MSVLDLLGIDRKKRKHTRCVYDICNFCGKNGGAWADLYGDDLVVFGGMWHGDCVDHMDPEKSEGRELQLWLPGAGPKERYKAFMSTPPHEMYLDISWNSSVHFGAIGDVSRLLHDLEEDDRWITPESFRGCSLIGWYDMRELIELEST